MNWYQQLKYASPMAPLVCPACSQQLLADVNQPVGSNGSKAYAVQGNGECYCRCPRCQKFIHMNWSGEIMNFTRPNDVYIASNEEVLDKTRFEHVPLVDVSMASEDEFNDFMAIISDTFHPISTL